MSDSRTKVLVVEDKDQERRAVLNQLTRFYECEADDILPPVGTYKDAEAALNEHAAAIALVCLDLNIPLDEDDSAPEERHGGKLLETIHELNRSPDVHIRVIVVSGQEIAKGWNADNLLERFKDTLIGVARKDGMPRAFIDQLQKLDRDPRRNLISSLNVGALAEYDDLMNAERPPLDRIEKARTLAIRLARNEMDYFEDRIGASERFGDNLNGLANELKKRFDDDDHTNKPEIKAHLIKTDGGWGRFVWRGWHVNHLFSLNTYYQSFKHHKEQPYKGISSSPNAWETPSEVLESLRKGKLLVQIVELIVRELLDWYLPWHEQVYVPWKRNKDGEGASS